MFKIGDIIELVAPEEETTLRHIPIGTKARVTRSKEVVNCISIEWLDPTQVARPIGNFFPRRFKLVQSIKEISRIGRFSLIELE